MKQTLLYIVFAATLLITPSCENFLDITPEGQVSRDELLKTPEGIEDALYGAYAQMRQSTLYGQNLSFYHLEMMAQTLYSPNIDALKALGQYDYKFTQVQDDFTAIWVAMYKNISDVNSILHSDLVKNAKEYPYTLYRGEALALRAFMHFDLMRIFCEQYTVNPQADGIPYQNNFSLVAPEFEKLEKNYEHVIADLLEADSLLACEDDIAGTTPFTSDRQTHMNRYAVQALLARVYLTMGNKAKALEYAKKVIEHSGRTLTPKDEVSGSIHGHVQGYISEKEGLFGLYYAEFYNLVYPVLEQPSSSFSYSLFPRYDIQDIYLQDTDGSEDFRVGAYFKQTSQSGYRMGKLTEHYELNNTETLRPAGLLLGINLIRLPEMYYICAEALLEEYPDSARGYYDEVLRHRGIKPLADRESDKTLTQERINLERYKEFIGEGQTFFNMKRQNLAITSADGEVTYQPSKAIYVVPIPDSEKENRY